MICCGSGETPWWPTEMAPFVSIACCVTQWDTVSWSLCSQPCPCWRAKQNKKAPTQPQKTPILASFIRINSEKSKLRIELCFNEVCVNTFWNITMSFTFWCIWRPYRQGATLPDVKMIIRLVPGISIFFIFFFFCSIVSENRHKYVLGIHSVDSGWLYSLISVKFICIN